MSSGGKYSVFPTGKLHIREAKQQDGFRSYRCQTKHRLTGETKQSSAGQLIVTESHSTVPPRITHREEEVKVQLGEIAFLPCAAEAFPIPTHRWYKQESGRTNPIVPSQRVFLMGGTLVFRRAIVMDSGKYVCLVNNSVGQERIETELIVVVTENTHSQYFVTPPFAAIITVHFLGKLEKKYSCNHLKDDAIANMEMQ
ncbi:down syndrome cell adhesion molecule homolog [Caerostris darwini]|uniref:Down syndrome cell adhesion molecule homolog n=1 Tax=Caerostris darwini TaxID=1538125 RepID=A0AAV4QVU3_9ARAC|nr:down syndrome cell adhesion molecule homolog [Caerostris darwini]